ncbi:MAG: hypothetical protein ACRDV9_09410 [Acidimicrobiia bacterium]
MSHYKDDFGVNAKLHAKIGKIGLEVGGSFSERRETTWHLRGHFGEPETQ